jgi:outer membrane protein TolC
MTRLKRSNATIGWVLGLVAAALTASAVRLDAQGAGQQIVLTLERMVELGLQHSYRVKDLRLNIERTRANLRAERAGLKSRVQLNVSAPQFESISEHKWNSALQRNELIYENTRRWEADLSVRQPVMLFGYPTNGELSFTNRVYRFSQIGDQRDTRYYNRFFFGYDQPLFQPNRMKNELEEAELDLEESELDYIDDVMGLVEDYADDYYELFEAASERVIAEELVRHLELATAAAAAVASADPARAIEADQIRIELANARGDLQQSLSDFRLQAENLKQDLRLSAADTLLLDPVLDIRPVVVEPNQAIELAKTLAPRLRQIAIERRQNEINLNNTRGNNSFRMNLSLTYCREVQDPRFQNLWREPRNSYTVDISAFVPIWDWGQRSHRIAASEIELQRTDLELEQQLSEIEAQVHSQIRNLQDYQQRALNMQENRTLAHQISESTLARYRAGEGTVVDLLQTINRENSTAENHLEAFIGYRRALLDLQQLTYFDFERNVPMVERFGIGMVPDTEADKRQ